MLLLWRTTPSVSIQGHTPFTLLYYFTDFQWTGGQGTQQGGGSGRVSPAVYFTESNSFNKNCSSTAGTLQAKIHQHRSQAAAATSPAAVAAAAAAVCVSSCFYNYRHNQNAQVFFPAGRRWNLQQQFSVTIQKLQTTADVTPVTVARHWFFLNGDDWRCILFWILLHTYSSVITYSLVVSFCQTNSINADVCYCLCSAYICANTN